MRACCPPGEGCNAPSGEELCALSVLKAADGRDAARALLLWDRYQRAQDGSRRFLRRAYGRARDRAIGLWTPWSSPLRLPGGLRPSR